MRKFYLIYSVFITFLGVCYLYYIFFNLPVGQEFLVGAQLSNIRGFMPPAGFFKFFGFSFYNRDEHYEEGEGDYDIWVVDALESESPWYDLIRLWRMIIRLCGVLISFPCILSLNWFIQYMQKQSSLNFYSLFSNLLIRYFFIIFCGLPYFYFKFFIEFIFFYLYDFKPEEFGLSGRCPFHDFVHKKSGVLFWNFYVLSVLKILKSINGNFVVKNLRPDLSSFITI